jgi:hypothetical protein
MNRLEDKLGISQSTKMDRKELNMAVDIPNCLICIHYFITYDPRRPYGCRAMGFKSRRNPGRVVYESSGIACQLHLPKKKPAGGPNPGGVV